MIGRADLLACLEGRGESERIAARLGFREEAKAPASPANEPHPGTSPAASADSPPAAGADNLPRARYLRLVGNTPVPSRKRVVEMPPELAGVAPLAGADAINHEHCPPPHPPLAPWSRLWPFLRSVLGERSSSSRLDLSRLVTILAEGRQVRRLPRLVRAGWADRAQVLVDRQPRLRQFREDFNGLCHKLLSLRGRSGLSLQVFEQGPEGECRPFGDDEQVAYTRYRLPAPGTRVLVLSDLGILEQEGAAWQRLGARLQRAGLRPLALLPVPVRLWPGELNTSFCPVVWDRGARLAPRAPLTPPNELNAEPSPLPAGSFSLSAASESPVGLGEFGVSRLLRLSSLALWVEPGLLRAIRYLLPGGEADVGSEAMVWRHPDVQEGMGGLALRPAAVERQREAAREEEEPALLERVAALVRAFHGGFSPAFIAMEELIQAEILGREPDPGALAFMRSMLVTVLHRPASFAYQPGLEGWVRGMASRPHRAFWGSDQAMPLAAALAVIRHRAPENEEVRFPQGFDLNQVLWALEQLPETVEFELRLRQVHWGPERAELELVHPVRELNERRDLVAARPDYMGSPLARMKMDGAQLYWEHRGRDGRLDEGLVRQLAPGVCFEIPAAGRLRLHGNYETLELDYLPRPAWAQGMGQDEYGLYADFVYQGIGQRFRWIAPGRFWMGSAEGEAERYDDELRHEVLLTQGYWLADTACTQGLWEVVMGNNPSGFKKGGAWPVEQVSWDDIGVFLDRLNKLAPGLEARLPSEAEWEFACRAGSESPFSFGANITPEQVNYDGNYPYAGGEKGLYREETVEVKELACNGWGLYQMHGNVWEWCADRYGGYAEGLATDPLGPTEGVDRVLRGGSWVSVARFCRSAYRFRHEPDYRNRDLGFRLARGRSGR